MKGSKLFRSRIILILANKAYRKQEKLLSKLNKQSSTQNEPEQQTTEENKMNSQEISTDSTIDINKTKQFKEIKQQQQEKQPQQQHIKSYKHYTKAVGLNNMGNTCYFNSALQCVVNTPGFNHFFMQDSITQYLNPKHKQVAINYSHLLKKMTIKSNSHSETPNQLKQAISLASKKFRGFKQEDSQELLRALLTSLHEDLNRISTKPQYKELSADISKQTLSEISENWFNYFKARDDSIVTDYFTGQLMSTVTCTVCKHQSIAFDNFQDLSLAFSNQTISIEEMLKFYFSAEVINSYTCAKCKQQRKCIRQLKIWRLPQILVIHLKRFQYNGPFRKKINNNVKYQSQLNMSSFYREENQNKNQLNQINADYQLYGLVKHYGDLNFGHYFAECKHPCSNIWYSLNDSSVSEIKNKTIETDNSAYLLFYNRII